jgi:hypothetical protein
MRRNQRRMEEIEQGRVETQRYLDNQPGPSMVDTFSARGTGFAPRGRGAGRGRGRGEALRGPPTGRMPQPTPTEPHEVQMEYYRQHPQGLPQWITGRYAAVPKTERLTAEELSALRAYLFLRRVSPFTSAERQVFMRGAEQVLSQTRTYEEWQATLAAHNIPNAEGEQELAWVGLPTETMDEPAIRAHVARQGITRERFQALHTWAEWSMASRHHPTPGGNMTPQQANPQGDAASNVHMDEDP